MQPRALLYTSAGLVTGIVLTLATAASPTPPVAAAQDAFLAAQKGQVIAAIYQLDHADLHDIEETLTAGTMPAGALGTVRKARAAALATDWPEPLRQSAGQVTSKLAAPEDALWAEEIAQAAPLAKDAHEVEHDFSTAVYGWLTGSPAPAPGHGH